MIGKAWIKRLSLHLYESGAVIYLRRPRNKGMAHPLGPLMPEEAMWVNPIPLPPSPLQEDDSTWPPCKYPWQQIGDWHFITDRSQRCSESVHATAQKSPRAIGSFLTLRQTIGSSLGQPCQLGWAVGLQLLIRQQVFTSPSHSEPWLLMLGTEP